MLVAPPCTIPLKIDLLSQAQGTIWHPNPESWSLHVWPLDGACQLQMHFLSACWTLSLCHTGSSTQLLWLTALGCGMSYRGSGPLNPRTRVLLGLGKWHIYSGHLYGSRLVVTQHFREVLDVSSLASHVLSVRAARAYSASAMIWDVYQWFRLGRIHPVLTHHQFIAVPISLSQCYDIVHHISYDSYEMCVHLRDQRAHTFLCICSVQWASERSSRSVKTDITASLALYANIANTSQHRNCLCLVLYCGYYLISSDNGSIKL